MAKRKTRIKHAPIVAFFAERLRELRRSRGMTKLELARQAHVTVSYIGRLESVGATPGIDLVDRLAKALGTSVPDLLPTTSSPDTLDVLRGQARRQLDALLHSADRETFLMLNPILALLTEASAKSR